MATEKLKGKAYQEELLALQAELCRLQEWVKHEGLKVVIVFEGRDGAGKGGTIKAITERVSPRVFRVVALPAPSDREKTQMYVQRYVAHFPAAGEIVVFDRSWYNRAGVEYVLGFCTPTQRDRFLEVVPEFERTLLDERHHPPQVLARGQQRGAGATLPGADRRSAAPVEAEQDRSPVAANGGTSTRGRGTRCSRPPTPSTRPGTSCPSDDKKRARLNVIHHLLAQIPYKKVRAGEGAARRSVEEAGLRRSGVAEGQAVRAGAVLTPSRCGREPSHGEERWSSRSARIRSRRGWRRAAPAGPTGSSGGRT